MFKMDLQQHFQTVVSAKAISDVDKSQVDGKYELNRAEQRSATIITKQMIDRLPIVNIEGICISVMGFDELSKLKVANCTSPSTTGMSGPNDSRFGTLEEKGACFTCVQNTVSCPGHLGMVSLNRWFLLPNFAEIAIRILMCVCNCCSRLLTEEKVLKHLKILELPHLARIKAISKICPRIKRCSNAPVDSSGVRRQCIPNPTYFPSKTKGNYIVSCEYTNPKNKAHKIMTERTIEEIYDILDNIDQNSLRILGFTGKTHPKNFVLKALPIIPPCAIPYVIRDGETNYDHITSAYSAIIRCNNLLGHLIDEDSITNNYESEKRKASRNLFFFISHVMDNSDVAYRLSKDEPVKSITERLIGKTELIRGNIMGKRVNYSGRAVLNSANQLVFGTVMYPQIMRDYHTTPVSVTSYNINTIKEWYDAGEVTTLVVNSGKTAGSTFKITDLTRHRYIPRIGDLAHRKGRNGDETMFDRQPTLDKLGIVGYGAVYSTDPNYLCIGIHSSSTTQHNADFDGDEGNKHKVQTIGARAEIRYMASSERCMMNAKANKPAVGLVYNCALSGYLMTQAEATIDKRWWPQAVALLQSPPINLDDRLALEKVDKYSGRGLFSILLPPNFYYLHEGVYIKNGVLISGVLTGKHLGPNEGSIIHHLHKTYDYKRTSQFVTEAQWLLDWYVEYRGFGLGYSSCMAADPNKIKEIITEEINQAKAKVRALGPMTKEMTELEKEIHENKVISCLNSITTIGAKISEQALDKLNALNVLVDSGTKGKKINIAQILGCLAQQFNVRRRPKQNLTMGSRCIPYFEPYSDEIEAHGFISESFMTGISPSDMFFHMGPSWTGLTDTALKTADTGHLQRRMTKVLEDLLVTYDGAVRNTNGTIFSYVYGYDGFNAASLINSESDVYGRTLSFIDIKSTVARLNSEAGY
jgi:DNA-directed RNA polymerase II subunit RPB1